MSAREEKHRLTRKTVLRFFICLTVSFFLWLFVMYTESPEYEQTYEDIRLEVRNYHEVYEYDLIVPENVTAKFRGTNVDLAACDKDDITAVLDMGPEGIFSGTRNLVVSFEFDGETLLTPLYEVRIPVFFKEAEMKKHSLSGVSVSYVRGMAGTQIEDYTWSASFLSDLVVQGRVEDIDSLYPNDIFAYIELSTDDIHKIVTATRDEQESCTLTLSVLFEDLGGVTATKSDGSPVTIDVTFTRPENSSYQSVSGVTE